MSFMYKSMGAKHSNWQLFQNNQCQLCPFVIGGQYRIAEFLVRDVLDSATSQLS